MRTEATNGSWASVHPGQRYEFVCAQIDLAGSSRIEAADRAIHVAKQRFRNIVLSVVESYQGKQLNWAGDGGSFLFVVTNGSEYDASVLSALFVLAALPVMRQDVRVHSTEEIPISVRLSIDSGIALYDPDPSLIQSGFLNRFLKYERLIGLENEVVITDRVYAQLSKPLRELFLKQGRLPEIEAFTYRCAGAI